jgi:glutathione-specific gamma-glutamylcyclotransferase
MRPAPHLAPDPAVVAARAPASGSPMAPSADTAGLERIRRQWAGRAELWVFGYASLIWRPEFEAAEARPALVHGFHRALRMRSRINRGTPQCPGLVFALIGGGRCRGVVYRVDREEADAVLQRLWAREMPTGVYIPRWLNCSTAVGEVSALAFTLPRSSPSYTGPIDDRQMLDILRRAQGRFGSTLDYLLQTARGLRALGLRDREIERLVRLAQRAGLA